MKRNYMEEIKNSSSYNHLEGIITDLVFDEKISYEEFEPIREYGEFKMYILKKELLTDVYQTII